jgi:hypothetical protein
MIKAKYIKKCKKQKKKFESLLKGKTTVREGVSKPNVVTNKSSHVFSNQELDFLNKGLKYRPRPKVPPINEVIVSVETSIKYLGNEKKACVRDEVARVISERKKDSLDSQNEWELIRSLREKDCVYMEPDKGKGVVVMDKESYENAVREHLKGPAYEEVKTRKEFPVDVLQEKVKKGLKEIVERGLMDRRETQNLTVPNPVIPSFSCLPKTHKPGNKIRPVVSNINTPASKISTWLVEKFRTFEKPESRSVKNSLELVHELEGITIEDDEMLVSFDVEALYPSVPVGESSVLLKEWIVGQNISDKEAELCCRLVDIVLEQRWIKHDELLVLLKEGLFIGGSISSILSEVFMGDLEKKMEGKDWFPRLWMRYVDDVVAVIKKGTTNTILENLNKQRSGVIKFTVEEETNGQFPFLDVLLIREGRKISFDIYRKPTDAPLCIPYDSHHPISHKLAAFESALFRMWVIPLSGARRQSELDYIRKMAVMNGYKEEIITKLNKKHERRWRLKKYTKLKPIKERKRRKILDRNGREVAKNVVLPYSKPFEKLGNVLKRQGMNVCYNSRGNLKELIGGVKRGRPKRERSGIYRIRCKKCKKLYYGQTKRRMEKREGEHDRAIRLNQPEKSAVAEHCLKCRHKKCPAELVKQVDKFWELDAWESMFIASEPEENLMNTGEPPIRSRLFNYSRKIKI